MRYLFDFLKQLSQYSDENMMHDYNLAVCWEPTLLPIPEEKDQVLHHNDSIEIIQTCITQSYQIFPRNYGLLLDDMTDSLGPGSISEDADLDETDDELDNDPDSSRDDTVSTFSLASAHNAPDLVMDLPASTADSSESAENLCSSPVHTLSSTGSMSMGSGGAGDARSRAISLNIDVEPVIKTSPMLASRKLELEKLGGIPLHGVGNEPRALPRKVVTASRLLQSPTGSSQASTGSSESLTQPSTSAGGHQSLVSKNATSSSSSATASPSLSTKAQTPGFVSVSSPVPRSDSAGTPGSGSETKSFPPPVLPKPTTKKP